MKRMLRSLLLAGGLLSFIILMSVQAAARFRIADPIAAEANTSHPSFKPDQDLVQAVARRDNAAVGRLLDDDFMWTDSQGRTLNKMQVLENLPLPALGDENQVDEQERGNRQIVIRRVARGNMYVLRVWVKRAAGWRALVYQEVSQLGALPATDSGAEDCENPCKTVPFTPQTEDEREVIHAYQQVERAVTSHDSAAWGAHIADDFFAVTSNSDRPLDKRMRMAGLDQQKREA